MAYIGLDLGSTYTKAALLENGRVICEKRLASPPRLNGDPDRYEMDAQLYFEQMLSLLEEFSDSDTQGILISTQMHGWVLTDEAFHPLTPYVSWQDRIGAKHLSSIARLLAPQDVEPAGVPLKPNLALCSLMGRMMEGFRLRPGTRLCTLGGYLIGRLTGRHLCHMTNAAPTGLADVRKGGWNLPLVHKSGLDELILPQIVSNLSPAGTWKGIPVYPDLGDQQVCAAGAELETDTCLHVSVGTAGLIGILTSEWGHGPFENRPWIQSGCYLRTVSGLPGGRNVAALKDEAAAALSPDIMEDDVWQMMTTLRADHLPAQANEWPARIESFYQDMGVRYRQASDGMERSITRLSFSGGCAAKNPELRRKLTEAFDSAASSSQDHDVMLGFLAIIAQLEECT